MGHFSLICQINGTDLDLAIALRLSAFLCLTSAWSWLHVQRRRQLNNKQAEREENRRGGREDRNSNGVAVI